MSSYERSFNAESEKDACRRCLRYSLEIQIINTTPEDQSFWPCSQRNLVGCVQKSCRTECSPLPLLWYALRRGENSRTFQAFFTLLVTTRYLSQSKPHEILHETEFISVRRHWQDSRLSNASSKWNYSTKWTKTTFCRNMAGYRRVPCSKW